MAKAKQYRWTCPECGKAKLAGKSPRRNATVRYCLPCSDHTGSLVARSCPVLDAARERGKAKSEAKLQQKRARKRERRTNLAAHRKHLIARCRTEQRARLRELDAVDEHYNLAALDLHEELRTLLRCSCVPEHLRGSGVELHLRQAAVQPVNRWGFATMRDGVPYISLTTWPGIGPGDLLAGLAHELAHHMTWRIGKAHGKEWRQAYCRLVHEQYSVWPQGQYLPARWDLDRAIAIGLSPIAKDMMRKRSNESGDAYV